MSAGRSADSPPSRPSDALAPRARPSRRRARRRRRRSASRGRRARTTAARAPGSRSLGRDRARLVGGRRRCRPAGCGMPSRSHSALKRSRSSARSIDAGLVPSTGMPAASSVCASFSGVCPPSATITPGERAGPSRAQRVADVAHVFDGERLEEEPVARVVVGRDGLGVAVDHHRLVARVGQRERGVHAAVVELDALADAVRAAAEDHDRRPRRAARPRPRPRRCRSGTACAPRTRPRRCRRSCR